MAGSAAGGADRPDTARIDNLLDLSDRTAGRLGLASTAVILLGALITAIAYVGPGGEGYSLLNHFISELGELGQSRLALVFDAGVVIGGIGLGLFVTILSRRLTGRYRSGLMLAGIVAAMSGCLVGVFPMDTHALHRIVSGAFFCTGWIVAAIFTVWLARHPKSGLPRELLAPGILSVVVDIVFVAVYATWRPVDPDAAIVSRPAVWNVPLLEWASLLTLLLWFVCVAVVLARRPVAPLAGADPAA